jgi:hypothetical protein
MPTFDEDRLSVINKKESNRVTVLVVDLKPVGTNSSNGITHTNSIP